MRKKMFVVLIAQLNLVFAYAQRDIPYQEDVDVIRRYDNMYPQPENPILFVGSSSIRLWKDFTEKFGRFGAINRGIGGAVINDIVRHADDLIFKYAPRQIVIYVGENDLPNASTTADSVLNRTKKLLTRIRSKLPNVPVIYIAMKPSPSRDQFQDKAMAGNKLIADYVASQPNTKFLDIYTPMLDNGKSRPELFLDDQLHMNEKGYAIWEKKLIRELKKR